MTDRTDYSRRQLLASAGTLGIAGVGIGRYRSGSSGTERDYTHATFASSNGPHVRVAWYSTYNGTLQTGSPVTDDEWNYDDTDSYVDGVEDHVDGPIVNVSNLLPGDSGAVSIGLLVADGENGDPASIWVRRRFQDDQGASSPLANVVDVNLWYDTGLFGVGGCAGADAGSFGEPLVEGTLATPEHVSGMNGTLDEGLQLDPGFFDNSCLDPGTTLCLGFTWNVDVGVGNTYEGTNGPVELQGSSTEFTLEFRAVDCGFGAEIGNPFDGEEQ